MRPLRPRQPQHKIHHHSSQKRNRQHRRPEPIIEPALAPHANTLGAPMERDQRVYHGGHGDEGEQPGGNLADAVAEVEKADGQPAQDHGEVQPGEEGALVGEEDFWLDARGERDAFAWREGRVSGCVLGEPVDGVIGGWFAHLARSVREVVRTLWRLLLLPLLRFVAELLSHFLRMILALPRPLEKLSWLSLDLLTSQRGQATERPSRNW